MKSHIGVDIESGLVHSVLGTPVNMADVTQIDQLLHGEETYVSDDAAYTGVEKRAEQLSRKSECNLTSAGTSHSLWLSRLLRGYCNYYHAPGNTRRLDAFRREIIRTWRHLLNDEVRGIG